MLTIRNARIVTPGGIVESGAAVVDNGRFAAVGLDSGASSLGGEAIDATGLTLLPGFLDVHIHGGGGADTMDATPESLRTILRAHARHGTTGLLLTTMTQSREAISAAIACAAAACRPVLQGAPFCPEGAVPLGIHLEGPYLCPTRAGAQPKEFVRDFAPDEFAEWLELADGTMRLMTMAPERPGADTLLRLARAAGIVVTIGHTDADADQAGEFLAATNAAAARRRQRRRPE